MLKSAQLKFGHCIFRIFTFIVGKGSSFFLNYPALRVSLFFDVTQHSDWFPSFRLIRPLGSPAPGPLLRRDRNWVIIAIPFRTTDGIQLLWTRGLYRILVGKRNRRDRFPTELRRGVDGLSNGTPPHHHNPIQSKQIMEIHNFHRGLFHAKFSP